MRQLTVNRSKMLKRKEPSKQQVSDEFRLWRSHCATLYDCVGVHKMAPDGKQSSTLAWLQSGKKGGWQLATATDSQRDNYNNAISVYDVSLPGARVSARAPATQVRLELVQDVAWPEPVAQVAPMPQRPGVVAAQCNSCVELLDFGRMPRLQATPGKRPRTYGSRRSSAPAERCAGHVGSLVCSRGGDGGDVRGCRLSWNTRLEGRVLSACDDGAVRLWDATRALDATPSPSADARSVRAFEPLSTFRGHAEGAEVTDVAWCLHREQEFVSVGSDQMLRLHDSRACEKKTGATRVHDDTVNAVSWSPVDPYALATGSDDATVRVWDVRRLEKSRCELRGHKSDVMGVQWSPHSATVIASWGFDRRVAVWDMERSGALQSGSDSRDGPPELLFVHGGHTAPIAGFSWHPERAWWAASVATDGRLHVWKMSEFLYNSSAVADLRSKARQRGSVLGKRPSDNARSRAGHEANGGRQDSKMA